jgi:hypothetical protein
MIRAVLCTALAGLLVLSGLLTALVQNENRRRAIDLDLLEEQCSMLEAINGERLEKILEKDCGPLPFDAPAAKHGPEQTPRLAREAPREPRRASP